MSAELLSDKAFSIISSYKNFNIGFATCTVPYYNNKHLRLRARLRAQAGKGSVPEIHDEAENIALIEKVNLKALDSLSLKKFLVDHNLGIDCSGLAFYILNAESEARGAGELTRHLSFPNSKGMMGAIRSKLRPIENTDVATLAHNDNSRIIPLKDVKPGDMITMVGGIEGKERDHILVVHEVNQKDGTLVGINYTHTVAWPTDGEYGHGIRSGLIRITDHQKPLTEQEWIEADKTGEENYTFTRAAKSKTEIRRLNWL